MVDARSKNRGVTEVIRSITSTSDTRHALTVRGDTEVLRSITSTSVSRLKKTQCPKDLEKIRSGVKGDTEVSPSITPTSVPRASSVNGKT